MWRLMLALLVVLTVYFHGSSPAKAQPALVFDLDTGEVLIAEEAGRPWYPASLTKLMTAYLTFQAVQAGRIRLNQKFRISKYAASGGGHGAARLGVKPGTELTVDRMLAFLLVRSDADMAVALAEAVGGSEKNFVRMMNAAARRLGMTGTRFVNPHGMGHPEQVTTARDMGMLAMAIYHHFLKKHPSWWQYFSMRSVKHGKHRQKNRNKLLFMMKGANGMKTGFICASGFNLLATATRGGRTLAAVVFGRKSAYTRASFAKIMLEEGFRRLHAGKGRRFGSRLAITQIRNDGGRAPDLSAGICKGRTIRMAEFDEVSGWGVAYGAYRASVSAEAAMEAERLAAGFRGRDLPGGVVRLPGEKTYAGLVWGLNEDEAISACVLARKHDVACKLFPPRALAELAALVERERAKKEAARAKRAAGANGRRSSPARPVKVN